MDVAAFVLSLLAVVFSGFAMYYTRSQAASSATVAGIETDRRDEEVRASAMAADRATRADVRVALDPRESNSQRRIVMMNRGMAEARDVSLAFVRALDGGDVPGDFERFEALSLALMPGGSEWLRLSPDYDTTSHYEVAVSWTDGAGPHRVMATLNELD